MLVNLGNALHSIYVATLPVGPIYVLHTTHVMVTAFMLAWHVRHGESGASGSAGKGRQRHPGLRRLRAGQDPPELRVVLPVSAISRESLATPIREKPRV
jgi:hypothetical protein